MNFAYITLKLYPRLDSTRLASPRPASTAASIKAPAFTAVYVRVVGIYIYVYI